MIVKASSGPRYVVGCRSKVDKEKLTSGTRVVLDMTTLTIMRALPREVCFDFGSACFSVCFVVVYNMWCNLFDDRLILLFITCCMKILVTLVTLLWVV